MKNLNQLDIALNYLNNNLIFYKKDYYLKYDTYFKMGGNVKLFICPQDHLKFKELIIFLNLNRIPFKTIGFTSNLLLFDEIEYSIIISTKNLNSLKILENCAMVDAGYSVEDLVRTAMINQSKGFEGLEGIPASIGGALFMNAGAYGHTISDNLVHVECINEQNEFQILSKEDCKFTYRNSIFKNGKYIILRALFSLSKKGDREQIAQNIEIFHIARHSYQDFTYPNLGSMISSSSNIYHKIFRKNKFYLAAFWILKVIYKNPISKFINRKRPNNEIFNKLLLKYLESQMNIKLKYKPSSKSVNILINNGITTTKDIVDYIFLIHELIDKDSHIENELVLEPVFSIEKEFELIYQEIIHKVKGHL